MSDDDFPKALDWWKAQGARPYPGMVIVHDDDPTEKTMTKSGLVVCHDRKLETVARYGRIVDCGSNFRWFASMLRQTNEFVGEPSERVAFLDEYQRVSERPRLVAVKAGNVLAVGEGLGREA